MIPEENNLPEEESGTPGEDPRERFRRLLEEPEDTGEGLDSKEPDETADDQVDFTDSRHPTGTPDQTAGWYREVEGELPVMDEPAERHPTGAPDQTAGWYREIEGEIPSMDEEPSDRHPTGVPDQTAGWYREIESESIHSQEISDRESQEAHEEIDSAEGEFDTKPTRVTSSIDPHPPPDEADTIAPDMPLLSRTPPPPLGTRPPTPPPEVDERGMPLPRRSQEQSRSRRRVSRPTRAASSPIISEETSVEKPYLTSPAKQKRSTRRPDVSCLIRFFIYALFSIVLVVIALASFVLYQYYSIASTLPSVDDLRSRASQFETTHILDRNGNLLYEILDPTTGRR
jgi:hypothetical protein